ncbi:aminoacyl-tRNA hydrolase [Oerskovia flava]|uniref:aminoacyl-tRNA hydrolase n=1 Tax=Oerskovia flava TaxID=2986422 RepID=UPI002240CC59|nr:aminoacyl-tRNA hydrolase [Oerskovia sp. JB1-3-2]
MPDHRPDQSPATSTSASDSLWLVVGLGNPGPSYAGNRHNVGHMALDALATRAGARFSAHRARAAVAEARIGVLPGGRPGPRVILAKPATYMNVSGGPVAGLSQYFGVEPGNVIVVHDEVDIPFGTVKLKSGGGEGGHNGLRDITKALGTRDYVRVRTGVGRPPGRMDTADYVLKDFSGAERKELPFLLDDAADAVEMVLTDGLLAAQGRFHTKA